jgi:hypothetical protein
MAHITNFFIGNCLPLGSYNVHSRFKSVVNFINQSDQLVFVTSNFNNISSNGVFINSINFEEIDTITIEKDYISINQHQFSRSLFTEYNSSFTYDGVIQDIFESQLNQLVTCQSGLLPEKSLTFLLIPEREKFFVSGFDYHFMLNAKESAAAIINGDLVGGINKIKGTGYGLTPAGDDFIAGILFGLHYIEKNYSVDLNSLRDNIYRNSLGQNLLVNSFILNAKLGRYFWSFKNLLSLLVQNLNYVDALKALLSFGATSGADLLMGYIFCIKHKIGI